MDLIINNYFIPILIKYINLNEETNEKIVNSFEPCAKARIERVNPKKIQREHPSFRLMLIFQYILSQINKRMAKRAKTSELVQACSGAKDK